MTPRRRNGSQSQKRPEFTRITRSMSRQRDASSSSNEVRSASEEKQLETLPDEVLVKILCCLDHSELKSPFNVSKKIRKATIVAKKSYFDVSTPSRTISAVRNFTDEAAPPRNILALRNFADEAASSANAGEIQVPSAPKKLVRHMEQLPENLFSKRNLSALIANW